MDTSRGTAWVTFYTKVRPWLVCITALTVVVDFFQYFDVYISRWWMLLYLVGVIVQVVLVIMVFSKSRGDYRKFFQFVNGVLIFETVQMVYNMGIQTYVQSQFEMGQTLLSVVIASLMSFFIWYRLNIIYFRKRLISTSEYGATSNVSIQNYRPYENLENIKTYPVETVVSNIDNKNVCPYCGAKLIEAALFCNICGRKIEYLVEVPEEVLEEVTEELPKAVEIEIDLPENLEEGKTIEIDDNKVDTIRKWKMLHDEGIISKEEFEIKRKDILGL